MTASQSALRPVRALTRAVLGLMALTSAVAAQATVLDFESWRCARSQPVCHVGNSYLAQGYTLSYTPAPEDEHPVGLQVVGRLWAPNAGGSVAMLANSCRAVTTLRADGGRPFSLLTMDLAEANGDAPATVAFTGRKSDGTQVSWRLTLDGRPGWQRIVLPSRLYNLVALSWEQGDCVDNKSHMFDNLLVMPGVAPR